LAETGVLYGQCRARVVQLATGLTEVDAAIPVPACPGWTVHDLVAHLCGVVDDARNDRMDDAPAPAWTARQVDARKDTSIADILDEWTGLAARFETLPLPFQAVADVASHEQDLRGALHVPGFRDNEAIEFVVPILLDRLADRVASHGLAPLEMLCGPNGVLAGAGNEGELVMWRTTPFEMFRATFGRRSRAQVLTKGWEGDATPYLDHVFVFGPAEHDLEE
jgi:uncharacterized protein (TIGR03083 family)